MKKIYNLIFIALLFLCGKAYAQCSTPTTTPYYEGFSGITANGQLPNCWAISNPSTCSTFTNSGASGNGAVFWYTPAGSSYFYTNGIQLETGVTYSTSLWYQVNNISSTVTWTDLSIFIGTNQNSTGLTQIVSTNGNVVNMSFSALSNTFVVPTSGVYYIAIKATSNGAGSGSYLNWDDLTITVPCTPSLNTPTVTIVAPSTVYCSGSTFTAMAYGANTYTWSDGSHSPLFNNSLAAFTSINFSVSGTSTLSGCTGTAALNILVNPSPNVFAISNTPNVCLGNGAVLNALGANTYTWNTGQAGPTLTVTPTVPTTYSVVGTATNGCTGTYSLSIGVQPLPSITYTSSAPTSTVCKGDVVTYTAGFQEGLSHYWSSGSTGLIAGNTFSLSPLATTTIDLKGSEEGGCSTTVSFVLNVDECTGLPKSSSLSGIKIYPNPGSGNYILESDNAELKHIFVTDVVGKIIFSEKSFDKISSIDLNGFPNGIYQILISTGAGQEHLKIIKQ